MIRINYMEALSDFSVGITSLSFFIKKIRVTLLTCVSIFRARISRPYRLAAVTLAIAENSLLQLSNIRLALKVVSSESIIFRYEDFVPRT